MEDKRMDTGRPDFTFDLNRKLRESMPLRVGLAVACLLLAILSFTVCADYFSAPERHKDTIASLDAKRQDVLELTGAATATSVLISAVPGDMATPIAQKFADMIQWFLIVLCAISLEKYLVTVMGVVAFRILIPIGLLLIAAGLLFPLPKARKNGTKVIAFALIIFLLIPASAWVSGIIERTYAYSVQDTLDSAESIQEDLGGLSGSSGQGAGQEQAQTESGGGLIDFLTGLPSGIADAAGDAATTLSGITQLPGQLVEELQALLNNFIESLAYMLITSCAIPLLVLMFFVFLIRMVFDGLFGRSFGPGMM